MNNTNAMVFSQDIATSTSLNRLSDSIDNTIKSYNDTLTNLIDKHAPLRSKTITVRTKVPWFHIELTEAKRNRRKCERVWKRTRLPEHRQSLLKAKVHVNNVVDKLKTNYYSTKFDEFWSSSPQLSMKSAASFKGPNRPAV